MLRIGNEVKGIINMTRDTLTGNDGVLRNALTSPPASFLPDESPYVEMGGATHLGFVYGISEYGGDDVVLPGSAQRFSFREFVRVRDI
jgi:hypothetical protein